VFVCGRAYIRTQYFQNNIVSCYRWPNSFVLERFEFFTVVLTKDAIWYISHEIRRKPTDVSVEHVTALLVIWFHSCFLIEFCFDNEDGGHMFYRNVGWLSTDYTDLYHAMWNSALSLLRKQFVWSPCAKRLFLVKTSANPEAYFLHSGLEHETMEQCQRLQRSGVETFPHFLLSVLGCQEVKSGRSLSAGQLWKQQNVSFLRFDLWNTQPFWVYFNSWNHNSKKKKKTLRGLSPWTNYTDWATAAFVGDVTANFWV
jgi:hypothetical protein